MEANKMMHATILFLVFIFGSLLFLLVFPYFFFANVYVVYLFSQYEFRMCVEVVVFVWKMTACGYSIWFPYILSVVIESNIELSFRFCKVLYLTFVSYICILYICILHLYIVSYICIVSLHFWGD